MDRLHQAIRDLDPDGFQKLCFHIQKERLMGTELRLVEGESGDEGLDLFCGDLSDGPIVFQCKSFRRGVGESQKEQIRASLRTAVRKLKPSRWILCVSIDLDPKAFRWFQRLQESYAGRTEVGLWQASDIAHELLHRREVREHFFPHVELDVSELRKLVARTGELSHEELEALTEQNLSEFIGRLKARDARFDYEIIFRPNGEPPPAVPRAGLMASIRTGSRTLNVLARDFEALRIKPPQLRFKFNASAAKKLDLFRRTGKAQEFTNEEIVHFETDWPMFEEFRPSSKFRLLLQVSEAQLNRRLKCQVVFGEGSDRVEYKLIEFKPVRVGVDEIEIESVSENIAFQLNVVLPFAIESESTLHLLEKFQNRDVKDVAKFFNALHVLRKTERLSLYELEQDVQLFSAELKLEAETTNESWLRLLANDLAAVSKFFKVPLLFPEKHPSANDLQSLLLLRNAASGVIDATNVGADLVKGHGNENTAPELLSNATGAFRFEYPFLSPKPILFDKEFDTGPCAITIEKGILENPQQVIESFRAARINDSVHLSIKPLTPIKFELLSVKYTDGSVEALA